MMKNRIRLLPLLVLVAGFAFVIRLGDFVDGVDNFGHAFAQHEVDEEAPPMNEEDSHDDDFEANIHEAVSHEDDHEDMIHNASSEEMKDFTGGVSNGRWRDATEEAFAYSETQANLYKDLAKRRDELNDKEKVLNIRAAQLKAAERELDQKLSELKVVREQIETLLREQDARQDERIASLVKIYEGMKAQDAARIFNSLDIDILIKVLGGMSERRLSPILAEMNEDRARKVTAMLAEQKRLPSLPQ